MLTKIKLLLEMIKFEHTIFALPFAYAGAVLAAKGFPAAKPALLILGCMVGARTAAMTFNRLADLPFDAENPRTRNRHLVTGAVKPAEAWLLFFAASFLYYLCAAGLNKLTLKLSPIAYMVILIYSYTKRFTWLCHLFLGAALALAPLGGYVAVRGAFSEPGIFLLAAGVIFWVAGFDILYACMDEAFDRQVGLHSVPARFGRRRAFRLSAFFHLLAFLFFAAAGRAFDLTWPYYLALALTAALFLAQRLTVNPRTLEGLDLAFFTFNGAISVVIFLGILLNFLIKG
ncbi:4-hydroxybenzoate octaprenyltransferase [Thermosulfurimonas marina]|uniref:4-hydroxybenzoate polyprenyltransferase n=1 Tax=Thermosulfurimonas marina TaxID=2047767 RepID=A0A6H1WS46_9BACT|nr:4-hydroxybenzoate octaprenyltransferase [Thermosulfurimonas marina]QJA05979.1 4-hydroxybenzoate octaprenyltransferase [Thermosulfurimonas marina]